MSACECMCLSVPDCLDTKIISTRAPLLCAGLYLPMQLGLLVLLRVWIAALQLLLTWLSSLTDAAGSAGAVACLLLCTAAPVDATVVGAALIDAAVVGAAAAIVAVGQQPHLDRAALTLSMS